MFNYFTVGKNYRRGSAVFTASLLLIQLTLFSVVSLYFPTNVSATANSTLTFQGKIVDKTTGINSTPSCVVAGDTNDTCDFRASIYTDPSGGTLLWREPQANIEIGQYNNILTLSVNSVCNSWTAPSGSCSGTGFTWGSDTTVYIQIEFDTDGNGDFVGAETFSRKLLSAVPYAFNADTAESANSITGGLDTVYLNDSDKVLAVNNVAGLGFTSSTAGNINFNLTSTGDFVVQTSGNSALVVNDNGSILIGNSTAATPVIVDAGAGTLSFGSSNTGKIVNIGIGTGADNINIGTGGSSNNSINIGSNSVANTITIGSNATGLIFSGSTTDIDAASGEGIVIQGRADSTFSTTAGNINFNPVGSATGSVIVGSGTASATPDLLILDIKNTAGDPTGSAGAMYYNSNTNVFRCYQNAAWSTCLTSANGFIQDGNSYGALATLGTNDNFGLAFETNGVERARIDTAGNFGIGTNNPSVPFHVVTEVGTAQIFIDTYNTIGGSNVRQRRARGTIALPTAVQSGDVIGNNSYTGYGDTQFFSGADVYFRGIAVENFSDSVHGSMISLGTTLIGTTGTVERFRVEHNGGVNINTAQTTGHIIGTGATLAAVTQTGDITGLSLDLSTNYTATNFGQTGVNTTLKSTTNTGAGTYLYNGYQVASGLTLTQSTAAGTTTFNGVFINNPNITQTTGTVAANALRAVTGTITTGGTQTGLQVDGQGVAAGNLFGVNISNITAGAGSEYGVNIGTGWDRELNFADATINIGVANNANLSVTDGTNNLLEAKDLNTNFGLAVNAGAFIDRNSYIGDEFNTQRTTLTADTTGAAGTGFGDGGGWGVYEGPVGATCNFTSLADTVNGIMRINSNFLGGGCLTMIDEAANNRHDILDADNLPVILMKVKPSSVSATNVMFAGMGDATDGAVTDPANFIGFTNNGGTTWTGRTTNASTSTNVTCTSQTISTTQFALLMVEVRSATDVHFFVDTDVSNGIAFVECGTGSATNIPTTAMAPELIYQTRALGLINQNLDIDFYRAWQDDNKQSETLPAVNTTEITQNLTDSSAIAATYPAAGDLASGSLVKLTNKNDMPVVTTTETSYDQGVVGVVTNEASVMLGNGSFDGVRVVISGNAEVQASQENGVIQVGDYLTSSTTSGSVMKATKAGYVVGQALSKIHDGEVTIMVKPGFYTGPGLKNLIAGLQAPTADENGTATEVSDKLGADLLNYFALSKANVDQTASLSEIFTDRLAAAIEIVTPTLFATDVNASNISNNAGSDLTIKLSGDNKLILSGQTAGTTAFSIDNQGNAVFAGTITADKVKANSIEGIEIITDSISSLSTKYQNLQSEVAGIQDQPAQTMYQDLKIASAEVSVNLKVIGQLLAGGSLTVEGPARFNNKVLFAGFAEFNSDVTFTQSPKFNSSTGGFAIIKANVDEVKIQFTQKFAATPIITVNPTSGQVNFTVTEQSEKGFTIKLAANANSEIRFNWLAFLIGDPTTTVSTTAAQNQQPVVPTQTPVTTPTVTEPVASSPVSAP